MLYLYHTEAGKPSLSLTGDEHRYIFKVRRHQTNEILYLRNLKDDCIYRYVISSIDKRSVELSLQESQILQIHGRFPLHIGWCVIDPKNIEKVLPSLNEMGVEKITFIYCKRSQKSFKLDLKRWEKILLNSSQQSGRSHMMEFETAENLKHFLIQYPEAKMVHFSDHKLNDGDTKIETVVVGCEGGFSEEEVTLFSPENIIGFDTPLVLKSESAVCAVAAKILL
jgi:16S rRNA (uracil1498-N3)-methyltransferase